MRKLYALVAFLLLFSGVAISQQVPRGMKYQAVARDRMGEVLANKKVALRISLLGGPAQGTVYYTEVHDLVTNQFGLFDLVIGEGKVEKGAFGAIPWSEEDIWMQVSMKDNQNSSFSTISNSKLLAVPYAFHAATASELVPKGNVQQNYVTAPAAANSRTGETGTPSTPWTVFGNSNTNSLKDKLGTTDAMDLVIITTNTERLRITKEGNIAIMNNLQIGNDLTVKNNVYLNTEGGTTTSNGAFTVDKVSATLLTGTLQVDKDATYKQKVILDNAGLQSTSTTTGALVVNGGTGIGGNLNVGGTADFGGSTSFGGAVSIGDQTSSTTATTGALTVAGGVGIGENLNTGGNITSGATISSKALAVSNSAENFLATFENTNSTDGDGIQIKLGRTHPAWNGSGYLNITNPASEAFDAPINTIRGWIIEKKPFQPADLLTMFPHTLVAGSACNIVNVVTSKLNDAVPLPLDFPTIPILPKTTIFPGLDLGPLGEIPKLEIPKLDVPGFQLLPQIPDIDCSMLPSFTVPNISFTDVSNSLTNKNQFISFVDKDNRELGSIRAQSVYDWSGAYLSGNYFVNLMASLAGIDLLNGLANALARFNDLSYAYNTIGVQYASGHADYAEWLERANSSEAIQAGQVVGVKSGKISKNLAGAEQIMVVSTNPIILGNTPPAGQEDKGEKVAFMGQVPVWISGPATAGDFIVADVLNQGYGKAVAPSAMTAQLLKYSIGRALETKTNAGLNMVNTLIGIDKADYVNVIESMDARLKDLEDKMNIIVNGFKKAKVETEELKQKNDEEVELHKAETKQKVEEAHRKEMNERRKTRGNN